MSTLDQIQQLSDGEFHRLGDDLLRRLEPRYRRLRTHGLNERGESIKGQPDSYVGDTAASCTIAVCYTVQRRAWWEKAIKDVRETVAACPGVEEVVVVLPRDVDRDGPKDKGISWRSKAQAAAAGATLSVVDGRDISHELDKKHQDLRYEHLGIPYSRLSGSSILDGCRAASQSVIDLIERSGRYDRERYVSRSADRELYRIWQSARKSVSDEARRAGHARLIALINDSGIGKTSLVCEFTRNLSAILPVLLVQARDLPLDTEGGLVVFVVESIHGFIEPSARVIEEAALCKHLAGTVPLTVVLDGLDEARDSESVRRTIAHWLGSKLGHSSILIVTSRREFWRTCSADSFWQQCMPSSEFGKRSRVDIAESEQLDLANPISGLRVPDRFTEEELEAAWLRSGQTRQELFFLSNEARNELRHPFTLRVFLDLNKQAGGVPLNPTRATLLECWLNRRLDSECAPKDRTTRELFQQALRGVASRIADASSGSITVDDLVDAPRFDPVRPPGPVLQRMIEANILETVPGQQGRVRFAIEAVQDFYRADSDLETIKVAPGSAAEMYSGISFTEAYARLERVGHRLATEVVGEDFVRRLAELDVEKAAVIVRAAGDRIPPSIKRAIADGLGRRLTDRHRVRAAMAIMLLGEMRCPEAIKSLSCNVLHPKTLGDNLKRHAARAFIKLNHVPAAPLAYDWGWFGVFSGNATHYFRQLLGLLRGASAEFKLAIADEARRQLSNASGTPEHAKAVAVLAHLGDLRLVSNLEDRLAKNGLLHSYEAHALIALGTDKAGVLFTRFFSNLEAYLSSDLDEESKQNIRNLFVEVAFELPGDVQDLLTPGFAPYLRQLFKSNDRRILDIAISMAKNSLHAPLLHCAALAADVFDKFRLVDMEYRACVTNDVWLSWWCHASDDSERQELMGILPLCPSVEVEEILIDCLEAKSLCGLAARRLGEYGAIRSASRLREILAETRIGENFSAVGGMALALGDLRDEFAVPVLTKLARENSEDWVVQHALTSLGLIGGREAEDALEELCHDEKDEERIDGILGALLLCGSKRAVDIVVGRAKVRNDGPRWLSQRLRMINGYRGWRMGEYFTHIECEDLVSYFRSAYAGAPPGRDQDVQMAFIKIDGPAIRVLLREWAGRYDQRIEPAVSAGAYVGRNIYFELLKDRGDESAIGYTLDTWYLDRDERYHRTVADLLLKFPAWAVARQLRQRLDGDLTTKQMAGLLALLGLFGERSDADLAEGFLHHPDDSVANAACESMLRLRDPLLVPTY